MERPGYYKHSAPLEPGGDEKARVLQTFGSAGAGRRWECRGPTNIRLRWSREEMRRPGSYKHSAPLEPGGDETAWVLQTFGSAGAGRRWECRGTTNIRLRWSREAMGMPGSYKHSAPLEPGGDGNAGVLETF